MRTIDGTAADKPVASRSEIWMSQELRAALFTRIEDPNYLVTYSATVIRLDFKPVE